MSMVYNNPRDVVLRIYLHHLVEQEIHSFRVRDLGSVSVVDNVDLARLVVWTRMVLDVEVIRRLTSWQVVPSIL